MQVRDISYFANKKHYDSTKKFSENDIINILMFLINSMLAMFGGLVFSTVSRHTYGHKLFSLTVPLFT